jgi:hypothetical protein
MRVYVLQGRTAACLEDIAHVVEDTRRFDFSMSHIQAAGGPALAALVG